MPDEDGYSLIRSIRTFPRSDVRNVPAIALTAFARAEDSTHGSTGQGRRPGQTGAVLRTQSGRSGGHYTEAAHRAVKGREHLLSERRTAVALDLLLDPGDILQRCQSSGRAHDATAPAAAALGLTEDDPPFLKAPHHLRDRLLRDSHANDELGYRDPTSTEVFGDSVTCVAIPGVPESYHLGTNATTPGSGNSPYVLPEQSSFFADFDHVDDPPGTVQ